MRQRHEELMADHKDMVEKPKVKMTHEFLLHVVDIYTREMFYKFHDEILESLPYRFELLKKDEDHNIYKIQRKNVEHYPLREIHYDKVLDFASCTYKKFESSGIPCWHVLGYLHKKHDYEKLPSQYILSRWTKKAKLGTAVDESGIQIIDDRSYLLKRNELIQLALDVVDKALTSGEATKVYTDALGSARDKINQMVGCSTSLVDVIERSQIQSVVASSNVSCNYYSEPSQVRAKGCGKRLKGGKAKALGRAKNFKARQCNGCGFVGQSHNKRNCPMLTNR
ncbi:protein FAR1-RELATED SEQUENCE 9-like [Cornus florida]|uniref:protein FAR1-RELATED SEQUENCE 9-like n=1 Tax=Cornus florida TaxID=4283 RepID=UPI00289C5578|nr:protein FAR1-RELATED SEQUENCE 9-like [Cornus florida]